jgi:hypothetical protein
VRVGEKETSEQAEIVARYADLFTREQHESLRDEVDAAAGDERERLYRLREACLGGIVVAEIAERSDRFENEFLAARVDFRGESLPLRSAQAMLAILDEYGDRDELGDLAADASARFNDDRQELMAAAETDVGFRRPRSRRPKRAAGDRHPRPHADALGRAAREQDPRTGARGAWPIPVRTGPTPSYHVSTATVVAARRHPHEGRPFPSA